MQLNSTVMQPMIKNKPKVKIGAGIIACASTTFLKLYLFTLIPSYQFSHSFPAPSTIFFLPLIYNLKFSKIVCSSAPQTSSPATDSPPGMKWPPRDMDDLNDFEKVKHLSDMRDGRVEGNAELEKPSSDTTTSSAAPEDRCDPDPNWWPWRTSEINNYMDKFEKYFFSDEPWSFEKAKDLLDRRNKTETHAEASQLSVDAAPSQQRIQANGDVVAVVPNAINTVKTNLNEIEFTV
ncbi:hypothetical protein RUND412_009321 [Rhizina undulata]